MPKMNVVRSVTIDAPLEKVFDTLNDLHSWIDWSPWLVMEPEASVTVADDGTFYEWNGKRVGSGEMKITSFVENKTVFYDLTFLTPWKSEAKVRFDVSVSEGGTNVAWTMESSMPWFMFWMVGMMEGFIAMDFDRGLAMLKEYIEKGTINSRLEFKGIVELPEIHYVGVKTTCGFDEIGEVMRADFGKLEAVGKEYENIATGTGYTIYHDWNFKKRETTYTACIGVTEIPGNISGGFFSGTIPASKVYILRHIGAYNHLGNAWSTLMSMERNKEFKKKKGFHPFEWYVSDPRQTPEDELITDICFGVK